MLRSRKVPLPWIFIASILLPICLIAAQYIASHSTSAHAAQPQDATTMLREVAMTNSEPGKVQDSTRLQVEASYGNLPLSFEPNRGQADAQVKFLSRAGNRTLWLTSDEAVLAVGRPPRPMGHDTKQAAAAKENQSAPAVLRMKFVGANEHPSIAGEAKQPGTVNYFAGKPNEWRTKIPVYARVRYRSLYPGIDLVFYGNNRELEYDLVVSPGADPGRIRFGVSGAENLHLDADGNLVLKTTAGDVVQQKPRIYQRKGTNLVAVAGDYVINNSKDEVGFRLGSYDRKAAVVIDPVLRYATFLGGSSFDQGRAIAVDSSNRAVVAGTTVSSDFPATTSRGFPEEVFITKFDFTGSRLIYSSLLIGSILDLGELGLALDSAGNAYVTGVTESHAFPTTPGAFQTDLHGDFDAFVTKLNANGTALVYSTFLGGTGRDGGHSIAVDSLGNAYITGDTSSQDFPTTPGAFQRNCKLFDVTTCENAFVSKLNASGSGLLYSTFLGGSTNAGQPGESIAVDKTGNAFVTGFTNAADFPTTAGTAQPVFPGGTAAFVSEVSSSGSHLVYSTFLGGGLSDQGRAIAVDSAGNAFVTGITGSVNFPVKNAFQPRCAVSLSSGCFNAFVTKLSTSGRLLYSTYLGGPLGGGTGTGIAVTADGKAYIAGTTSSVSFPTTQTAFQRVLTGEFDNFLTKLDPTGKIIYSSYLGTATFSQPPAVALDRDTNAYVTGTADAGFPVTPGAFQQKNNGESDAFVAKVVSLCALSTVNRTVTICSPGNGSTVASPVRIIAGTTDVNPVKLTQVYLDGKKIYETPLSAINVGLPIAAGTHRLTVQGLDTAGVFFKKPISINVSPH
ncbi:MAG: SBBP repeat-containing protein [Candidatus Angelobacter sp.]